MQVFRVFGIVPDARSPLRSFENPVDFATADVAAAGYKTTALPIELGRRVFRRFSHARIANAGCGNHCSDRPTTSPPVGALSLREEYARVRAPTAGTLQL